MTELSENQKQKKYFKAVFGTYYPDRERIDAALRLAHEIRQFEIRLYWQRSLFFWGFILALFTAFFVIWEFKDMKFLESLFLLMLCYIGFFFSFAWQHLETGSKSWQKNWEMHIDYLEDDITGKLHKTTIGKTDEFFSLNSIHSDIINMFILTWCVLSFFGIYAIYEALLKYTNISMNSFAWFALPFFETFEAILIFVVNLFVHKISGTRLFVANFILLIMLYLFMRFFFLSKGSRDSRGRWRTSIDTNPGDLSCKPQLVTRSLREIAFPPSPSQ